jgi:hypothetical protein
VTFGPGLGDRTVVHLSGVGEFGADAQVEIRGDISTVTAPAAGPLTIRFL